MLSIFILIILKHKLGFGVGCHLLIEGVRVAMLPDGGLQMFATSVTC